jgi:hypothetical protein
MTSETAIALHRSAPWNASLPRGIGNAYAQVGARMFCAQLSGGLYTVTEVDAGRAVLRDGDTFAFVTVCAMNRAQVRAAISLWLAGESDSAITNALLAMPGTGTGRNHPDNVARRHRS